jgi:hypothetical protein
MQWNWSKVEVQSQSDMVQHDLKVRMKSRGLLVRNTHLCASRSYYSLGLGYVPTTRRTLGGEWGGQMTYGLVGATLQVAVPLCAQSVLATVHSDQV